MESFEIEKGRLLRYHGTAEDIIVPAGVREIGEAAFEGCTALQSITLPESLQEIGGYAFGDCTGLRRITVPEGVQKIGVHPFRGCRALEEVCLPGRLGRGAWREDCPALQRILPTGEDSLCRWEDGFLLDERGSTLLWCPRSRKGTAVVPAGVEVIGEKAFKDCDALEEVLLPEGLRKIEADAFSGCRALQHMAFPRSLRSIGARAFAGSGVQRGELPETLASLDVECFGGCSRLEEICLPTQGAMHRLPAGAFEKCRSLTHLTLPRGLVSIGEEALAECTALEELTVPEGVCDIERGFVRGCEKLARLILPQSLETMDDAMLDHPVEVRIPGDPTELPGWLLEGEGCLQAVLDQLEVRWVIAPQLLCACLEGSAHQEKALLGFLHAREEGLEYADEDSWTAWARQERDALAAQAEEDRCVLRWLLREKLLKREECLEMLPEADLERRVWLVDYLHECFPAAEE